MSRGLKQSYLPRKPLCIKSKIFANLKLGYTKSFASARPNIYGSWNEMKKISRSCHYYLSLHEFYY